MMLTSPLLIYCWTDDIQKRRFICDCSGLGNRMTQFCFKNSCGFSMRPGEGTLPGKHQCLPRSCRHLWPGGSRGPSSRSCALGSEKLASCFFVWHAWLVIQRSVMFAKHLLNIYRRRLRDKRRWQLRLSWWILSSTVQERQARRYKGSFISNSPGFTLLQNTLVWHCTVDTIAVL